MSDKLNDANSVVNGCSRDERPAWLYPFMKVLDNGQISLSSVTLERSVELPEDINLAELVECSAAKSASPNELGGLESCTAFDEPDFGDTLVATYDDTGISLYLVKEMDFLTNKVHLKKIYLPGSEDFGKECAVEVISLGDYLQNYYVLSFQKVSQSVN